MDWQQRTLGTNDLEWITFGNGVFVVAATNYSAGQMAVNVSADGAAWVTQGLPSSTGFTYPSLLFEVSFGNGMFLASTRVDYSDGKFHSWKPRFFTSVDATNWIADAFYDGPLNTGFISVANGQFFLVFLGAAVATVDGSSVWSVPCPSDVLDVTSLSFLNERYLLTAASSGLWVSSTATNWTGVSGGVRSAIKQVIRGGDRYLAVGGGTLLSSGDGVSFAPVAGAPSVNACGDIGFDGRNYVLVAENGRVYTSNDGSKWVQRTSNTGAQLFGVCKSPYTWVAVGAGGTVITSPTTLAWTLRTSGSANNLRGVAYGNGIFVAIGDGGTVISSPDGAAWEVQYSGTTAGLNRVRFLNGAFFAVGANGTLLSSLDGAIWQQQDPRVSLTLTDITWGDARFIACGFDTVYFPIPGPIFPHSSYAPTVNVLLESADGMVWSDITRKIPAYPGLLCIAFLNGSFWAGGEDGTILQSDSVDGAPRLAGTMLPGQNAFQVKVSLNVPASSHLQASTDLSVNSWEAVHAFTNGNGPCIWLDTNAASLSRRYYRLVSP